MTETIEHFQPAWLATAKKELGQREIVGDKDNPRIVEYHQETTLKATDDETAWCSAFVNWCMAKASLKGTRSAAARSWLQWGKMISTPAYGCVVILERGGSPTQGHVGFFMGTKDGQIALLGGNQGNAVSVTWFPASKLLGYRWPA